MDENNLPLTDAELASDHPAVAELVRTLDDVARRDPNPNVAGMAFAFARYFRTRD